MSYRIRTLLAALIVTCSALTVFAIDGVVLIDQNRALAGNVTPGDAPGFPVTISQPGSYKLSGNLTVPANTNGILIAADQVTLDLNGFSISGSGSGSGISNGQLGRLGTAIRNGIVRKFGEGIDLGATGGREDSTEIQQIRAFDNAGDGIVCADRAIVTGNTAMRNGFVGILLGGKSIVTGNTTSDNQTGLSVGAGTVIQGNSMVRNTLGLNVICPANVTGNAFLENQLNAVTLGTGLCSLSNNDPAAP